MILTFIFISVLIIGIIFAVLSEKKNSDGFGFIALFGIAGGVVFTFLALFAIICEHTPAKLYTTKNEFLHRRAALIARYENCNQMDDLAVITEIEEFNAEIENGRYLLNNPWVNWFTSPVYNEIEVVDREELNRKPIEIEVKEK